MPAQRVRAQWPGGSHWCALAVGRQEALLAGRREARLATGNERTTGSPEADSQPCQQVAHHGYMSCMLRRRTCNWSTASCGMHSKMSKTLVSSI
eukprot:scaffold46608_cov33-Tisochrysis_lutea.AAC.2